MRLAVFIISLMLLAGTVDATTGWLAVLASLAGIAAFRLYPWRLFIPRPTFDVRMASFVLALLLAFGAVDATKDWLIAMSAVSGVAAFMPGIMSLEDRRGERGNWWGSCDGSDRRSRRLERRWRRWEQRFDREAWR